MLYCFTSLSNDFNCVIVKFVGSDIVSCPECFVLKVDRGGIHSNKRIKYFLKGWVRFIDYSQNKRTYTKYTGNLLIKGSSHPIKGLRTYVLYWNENAQKVRRNVAFFCTTGVDGLQNGNKWTLASSHAKSKCQIPWMSRNPNLIHMDRSQGFP